MSLKFVPPKSEEKKFPRYATYVHGADMKTHSAIGPAKNSLNNRMWTYRESDQTRKDYAGRDVPVREKVTRPAFLLEMVDGEYYVLHEVKEGSKFEDLPWVKEYLVGSWHNKPYTDYEKDNKYYQDKIADGSYRIVHKAVPLTTDEYVNFRLAVAREQWSKAGQFKEVTAKLEDEV